MLELLSFFNIFGILTAAETTAAEAAAEATKLFFEPKNFINMLGYMGKGMLVIFIIIGVIILVTILVSRIFSRKSK